MSQSSPEKYHQFFERMGRTLKATHVICAGVIMPYGKNTIEGNTKGSVAGDKNRGLEAILVLQVSQVV